MNIVLMTESLTSNSIGRTYCLWLLAKELGWGVSVLTTQGDRIWEPLANSEFSRDVQKVARRDLDSAIPDDVDLVIGCKPLWLSFGLALRVGKRRKLPVMVDIDDPDLELRIRPEDPFIRKLLRWGRHPIRRTQDRILAFKARRLPSFVSNPWLGDRYGGTLIPHVRPDLGDGSPSTSDNPHVVFVGTAHAHKGVPLLRDAIRDLQPQGFTLTITDKRPSDAAPWERWVGNTSLEEGADLVRNADIVALPSIAGPQTVGQLPAKLIDAMMLGRAVAVSDVPPMGWAVDDAGVVFEAGSLDALREALVALRSPEARAALGRAARNRALKEFSLTALSPRFERACLEAVGESR